MDSIQAIAVVRGRRCPMGSIEIKNSCASVSTRLLQPRLEKITKCRDYLATMKVI